MLFYFMNNIRSNAVLVRMHFRIHRYVAVAVYRFRLCYTCTSRGNLVRFNLGKWFPRSCLLVRILASRKRRARHRVQRHV
jgi:hypothetical protein